MLPEVCPGWFQGFNLAFQIIFFIVTISISFQAYRAYNFFAKEQHKYLSLGFAIFALSYVAQIMSTSAHLMGGARDIAVGGLYAHAYLFLAGVMVLLFVYLKIEQPAVRAVLLILVFGFIAVFTMPGSNEMIFHLVTALLMFFIVGQLTQGYKRTCKRSTLFVTIGFAFLTLGQLLLSVAGMNGGFFVTSAIVTLAGFLCISASRVVR